ncbi:MAG: PRC-barrel domain-containing protein [Candidatus Paceibacteria bacterium]
MRSSLSKLKGRDVATKSGVYLGKVRDIIIDLDNGMVVQYAVSKFPFPDFFGEEKHLINHNQVAAFKEEVIVVKDARLESSQAREGKESAVNTNATLFSDND